MPGSPKKRERRLNAGLPVAPLLKPGAMGASSMQPEVVVEEQALSPSAPAREKGTGDAREFLRGTVDEQIDFLAEQLLKSAQALKRYTFNCPWCHKNVNADIRDHKVATDSIDKLIALGYGRKTQDSSKHEGFVLERLIIRPDEEAVLDVGVGTSSSPDRDFDLRDSDS